MILFELITVFLKIFSVCIFISGVGYIFKKKILSNVQPNIDVLENGLFGYIFLGFITLLINFFLPLNIFVNSILFILTFLYLIKDKYFQKLKTLDYKLLILVSFIAFIMLIYSNVNRPDAHSYHLPFSKMIAEHKIILGSANIHFRFGHISIFQYINSFFDNFLLREEGTSISTALLVPFFIVYIYLEFHKNFLKNNKIFLSLFLFFIFCISVYSLNNYSSLGNDGPGYLYFFLLSFYLVSFKSQKKDEKQQYFEKALLISIFLFFIKVFYIIILIAPFIIFLLHRKSINLIKSKINIFSYSFFILWIIKNIFVSGCAIYPINFTCNSNLIWNTDNATEQSINGEAWAKDWINREDENLGMKEHSKNFIWFNDWKNNHFKIIKEKTVPILIFILFNIIFFYLKKCLNNKKNNIHFSNYYILLFITILGSLIWFLKFPIYRFGLAYLYILLITITSIIIFKKIEIKKIFNLKNYFNYFMIALIIGVTFKNFNRILDNKDQNIWPNLRIVQSEKLIKHLNSGGEFMYYMNKRECGYSPSPCTNNDILIDSIEYMGYLVYYKILNK